MAIVTRTGIHEYKAKFDISVLTNDTGMLLIDLEITKWGSGSLEIFTFSRYRFLFSIEDELTDKVKTKLLLGIKVHLTVPARYEYV